MGHMPASGTPAGNIKKLLLPSAQREPDRARLPPTPCCAHLFSCSRRRSAALGSVRGAHRQRHRTSPPMPIQHVKLAAPETTYPSRGGAGARTPGGPADSKSAIVRLPKTACCQTAFSRAACNELLKQSESVTDRRISGGHAGSS